MPRRWLVIIWTKYVQKTSVGIPNGIEQKIFFKRIFPHYSSLNGLTLPWNPNVNFSQSNTCSSILFITINLASILF